MEVASPWKALAQHGHHGLVLRHQREHNPSGRLVATTTCSGFLGAPPRARQQSAALRARLQEMATNYRESRLHHACLRWSREQEVQQGPAQGVGSSMAGGYYVQRVDSWVREAVNLYG